jgi:hypothetical protein
MKKQFGHYIVEEETKPDGSWAGYRVSAIESTGKQGKLYIKSDGREYYQAAPKKDEELEI